MSTINICIGGAGKLDYVDCWQLTISVANLNNATLNLDNFLQELGNRLESLKVRTSLLISLVHIYYISVSLSLSLLNNCKLNTDFSWQLYDGSVRLDNVTVLTSQQIDSAIQQLRSQLESLTQSGLQAWEDIHELTSQVRRAATQLQVVFLMV